MIQISESTIDCKTILTHGIIFQGENNNLLKILCDKYFVTHTHIAIGTSSVKLVTTLLDSIQGPIGVFVPEFFKYLERTDLILLSRDADWSVPQLNTGYDELFEKLKAIIISNPHNPTGLFQDITLLLVKAKEHDVLVIVDEAYIEFVGEQESLAYRIKEFNNLVVVRTFSKFYGLQNDKVAYAIGPEHIVELLKDIDRPSDIALRVAAKLLSSEKQISTLQSVFRRRQQVMQTLVSISCEVIPSAANFIMARHKNGLFSLLENKNIDCMSLDNQVGLEKTGFCRIAVTSRIDLLEFCKRLKQ